MSVKSYQKIITVQAIQFQGYPPSDPLHMNEVMSFVQVPITLEMSPTGVIQLRVIISQYLVLVVPAGDYIVRDATGKLSHMNKADLEAEYTLVK
ncbi:hypothetical protein ABIE27_005044 [Paenibacillus sp. 4624]|uniref:hypothetical protein n=1 Tax=Paenibacillus sp. 4624 TaxID=3156453 RepID=UPI003D20813F